jgi:DNA-binding MarR family transcriptional regulator
VNAYAHTVNTLRRLAPWRGLLGTILFLHEMAWRERGMTPRDGNLVETVKLLGNVAGQQASNQRALARQIGISVGLVNALVHRAVHKGLIKIKEAPARRYAYYLTPKGFAEKSRLVAEYLDYSLSFFRIARQEYADVFARCGAAGTKRVVLCGAGELAEIATLAANGNGIEIVAVLDRETNQVRIAGLPVVRDVTALGGDDVLVITDGRKPQELYEALVDAVGEARVHAPPFLRIAPRLVASADGVRP